MEDEETVQVWETKGQTGIEAWCNLMNHFGIEFNTGAVLSVACEVDHKEKED